VGTIHLSDLSLDLATRLVFLRHHRGFLTRIARRVGVTPQSVSRVYHGLGGSRRIKAAIESEARSLTARRK
jgi:hypothetical protein